GAGSDTADTSEPEPDIVYDLNIEPFDPVELEAACADIIDSVYGDPGELPEQKGAVIRCAADGALTIDDIRGELQKAGNAGKLVRSSARVYRVLYRTERGNGQPGYSSALVYLPDAPPAEKLPLVVASHGSRGQAAKCAPSVDDPAAQSVRDDFIRQVYPLVGFGFPVIVPDLAGYANFGAEGNPPSAYASAADVSKSTLDGARALRKLVPSRVTDEIVLTGHSQGGHTALSALAALDSYGADGTIKAVVAHAPLWLSQRSWGAVFILADSYPIKTAPVVNAVTIWYHYTHAELLDGPEAALEMFPEANRDAIKQFVQTDCWSDNYPILETLGKTLLDVFDPAFYMAVMASAGAGAACSDAEPAKSICETWMKRYIEDRPHLVGGAAKVPLLVIYGGKDTTIPPDRFQCALDRLVEDKVPMTQCFDPDASHGEVVATQADFVLSWLAGQTLGIDIPVTCPADEIKLLDNKGNPVKCPSIPPND
ncbi:MAG: alpha/beta fold hydrolase, partial [Deltaproteobacteria bacterium]|nr:alpha/beta fold hydrolase [Deltaproteobacteria bacterium]